MKYIKPTIEIEKNYDEVTMNARLYNVPKEVVNWFAAISYSEESNQSEKIHSYLLPACFYDVIAACAFLNKYKITLVTLVPVVKKTYKIKAQRSLFPTDNKILIYSKCGKIPPTELPNSGALKKAMGDREKVYFECRLEDGNLILLRELNNQNW